MIFHYLWSRHLHSPLAKAFDWSFDIRLQGLVQFASRASPEALTRINSFAMICSTVAAEPHERFFGIETIVVV
jgi:hypothetical protein